MMEREFVVRGRRALELGEGDAQEYRKGRNCRRYLSDLRKTSIIDYTSLI
jgi:hypothetical protein